jgi:hypothetical protein
MIPDKTMPKDIFQLTFTVKPGPEPAQIPQHRKEGRDTCLNGPHQQEANCHCHKKLKGRPLELVHDHQVITEL